MSDIKPCPFCGSVADSDCSIGTASINCNNCDAYLMDINEPFCDDVLARWNNRPIEDSLKQKLKEAERVIAAIREIDWNTDHCDAKNMLADEYLEKYNHQLTDTK